MLTLTEKKAVVAAVREVSLASSSLVTAEYRGLTVKQMLALRVSARKMGVDVRVIRNNLAKRAFEGTPFECALPVLTGPLVFAFSLGESPSMAARLVKDFSKENDKLKVRSLVLGGKLLEAGELSAVASLPTREQALGQLASVLQAPISKLVRTFAEPAAQLARVVDAVRASRESNES